MSGRVPLWTLLRVREEFDQPDLSLLTVVSDLGVRIRDMDAGGRATASNPGGYKVVHVDDLVVNRLWARFGAYGVSAFHGIISPAYWVLEPDVSKVNPRYLHSLLRSSRYQAEVARRSKDMPPNGFDLPWDQFRHIEVELPSLEEQQVIADYLDAETARIDALIEKKQRMIDLLAERRSIAVRNIATSDAHSRIGAVFSSVAKRNRHTLRSLFQVTKGRDAQRLSQEYVAEHSGPYPVYSGQTGGDGIFGSIDTHDFDCPSGAILVATVGAGAMSMRIVSGKFSLSQNCALLTPRQGRALGLPMIKAILEDTFISLRSFIPDHMQPSLRIEDLSGLWLTLPNETRQHDLSVAIVEVNTRVDSLVRVIDHQIEKLKEFRTSLVSVAVSGEINIERIEL